MNVAATSLSRAPAPATRLPRLGFVGIGWIGANRLRYVANSGRAQIVALSDVQPEAARAAARDMAIVATPPVVCSFDELLESELDGVVIAIPHADHLPLCVAALERDLAVFCQKPLGRTAREVERIVARARERDRLLAVDFCYRHVAGVPELKDMIRNGVIGRVYAADLTFHNAYGPDKPWFFDAHKVGGGCCMDLGIHLVDLLLWATGYPQLKRISAQLYRDGERLEPPIEDFENFATAELSFADGLNARLACSWHLPAGQDAVIEASFFGTKGAVRLRNVDGSFYDFVVEHCQGTRRSILAEPSRDWGGTAICSWAKQLASSHRFDPRVESVAAVHRILDEIYGR
jgi:predicted dehydrogenase